MKIIKVIVNILILCVVIYFSAKIYSNTVKQSRIPNIDKIYPDSVQVLTITGDTATIYGTSGHRMIRVYNPK